MVSGVGVGEGVGATLLTVTETFAAFAVFPAASRAVAESVCDPSETPVVSQEMPYREVVSSLPKFTPSSLNCTPETPTPSEADAETVTEPETVAPELGEEIETVGGVVSPGVGEGVVPPPVA